LRATTAGNLKRVSCVSSDNVSPNRSDPATIKHSAGLKDVSGEHVAGVSHQPGLSLHSQHCPTSGITTHNGFQVRHTCYAIFFKLPQCKLRDLTCPHKRLNLLQGDAEVTVTLHPPSRQTATFSMTLQPGNKACGYLNITQRQGCDLQASEQDSQVRQS
jgi:hypothetical protein